jgi:hypothetical protein
MTELLSASEAKPLPPADLWWLCRWDLMHYLLYDNQEDASLTADWIEGRYGGEHMHTSVRSLNAWRGSLDGPRAAIAGALGHMLNGSDEYQATIEKAASIQNTFGKGRSERLRPSSEIELAAQAIRERIIVVRNSDFRAQIAALNDLVEKDPAGLYVSLLDASDGPSAVAKLEGFYVAEYQDYTSPAATMPGPGLVVSGQSGVSQAIPLGEPENGLYLGFDH